mmetsp:Transcript_62538/g.167724  ORF Transcript_62538/g.167724 Transcript_62538/m.167724 type:complete len:277 (+) Transcript_62538:585-1415(+)
MCFDGPQISNGEAFATDLPIKESDEPCMSTGAIGMVKESSIPHICSSITIVCIKVVIGFYSHVCWLCCGVCTRSFISSKMVNAWLRYVLGPLLYLEQLDSSPRLPSAVVSRRKIGGRPHRGSKRMLFPPCSAPKALRCAGGWREPSDLPLHLRPADGSGSFRRGDAGTSLWFYGIFRRSSTPSPFLRYTPICCGPSMASLAPFGPFHWCAFVICSRPLVRFSLSPLLLPAPVPAKGQIPWLSSAWFYPSPGTCANREMQVRPKRAFLAALCLNGRF